MARKTKNKPPSSKTGLGGNKDSAASAPSASTSASSQKTKQPDMKKSKSDEKPDMTPEQEQQQQQKQLDQSQSKSSSLLTILVPALLLLLLTALILTLPLTLYLSHRNSGFTSKYFTNPHHFTQNSIAESALHGRTAIITGGTSGLGYEMARQLTLQGMEVIITSRDEKRGEQAATKIREALHDASAAAASKTSPKAGGGEDDAQAQAQAHEAQTEAKIRSMKCDLSSLVAIRQFVDEFKALNQPLHTLIINAAVMKSPSPQYFNYNSTYGYNMTTDGFEEQIGVNYVGHWYLVNELLESLRVGARDDNDKDSSSDSSDDDDDTTSSSDSGIVDGIIGGSRIIALVSPANLQSYPDAIRPSTFRPTPFYNWVQIRPNAVTIEKPNAIYDAEPLAPSWYEDGMAYAQSKLALILMVRELGRRLDRENQKLQSSGGGVSAYAVDPGWVRGTKLWRYVDAELVRMEERELEAKKEEREKAEAKAEANGGKKKRDGEEDGDEDEEGKSSSNRNLGLGKMKIDHSDEEGEERGRLPRKSPRDPHAPDYSTVRHRITRLIDHPAGNLLERSRLTLSDLGLGLGIPRWMTDWMLAWMPAWVAGLTVRVRRMAQQAASASVEDGTLNPLYVVTAPTEELVNGGYYSPVGRLVQPYYDFGGAEENDDNNNDGRQQQQQPNPDPLSLRTLHPQVGNTQLQRQLWKETQKQVNDVWRILDKRARARKFEAEYMATRAREDELNTLRGQDVDNVRMDDIDEGDDEEVFRRWNREAAAKNKKQQQKTATVDDGTPTDEEEVKRLEAEFRAKKARQREEREARAEREEAEAAARAAAGGEGGGGGGLGSMEEFGEDSSDDDDDEEEDSSDDGEQDSSDDDDDGEEDSSDDEKEDSSDDEEVLYELVEEAPPLRAEEE